METQQKYQELLAIIMRVMNKLQIAHKVARYFGTDEKLTPREAHTIQAIGRFPEINVTELADRLGVTKGTASPMVAKLARKKLVIKMKAPENCKEIRLRLSPKGEVAFHAHEMFDRQLGVRLFEVFETANHENLQFLEKFLETAETVLDEQIAIQ